MRNNSKKVWLFDFDGTLVDSMPIYGGLMLRILDEHGISYPNDILKIITPLGFLGTAKYFRNMGIEKSEQELVNLMTMYATNEYTYNVPAKKNVIEVLKKLKENGDSLNVLTASPHTSLDPCLKRLGVFELFDNVWSCDDFSTTKADPEIYRLASKRLGVTPKDVIFLDDNLNADKTAKRAGMVVYGVYDDTSKEYVEEMKNATDRYIYDFIELISDTEN